MSEKPKSKELRPTCGLAVAPCSAAGAVESLGYAMKWEVDQSACLVEIEVGVKWLTLDRDEAIALLECLNAALPHMAVKF